MGPNPEWTDGYREGWNDAVAFSDRYGNAPRPFMEALQYQDYLGPKASKPKRKQSKKQKILNEMAGSRWKKYKKGSGKKTYFDIRAEVTRSAIYKKRVKNL